MEDNAKCYCDPNFLYSGCNEAACFSIAGIFIPMFGIPIIICIYRLYLQFFKADTWHSWHVTSYTFIILACLVRIIRSGLLFARLVNPVMGFLHALPAFFLICSFLNTLYVWIKIIYAVNFSKVVEKVFPVLGWIVIGSQVLLFVIAILFLLLKLGSMYTNITIGIYIFLAGIAFAILGKMIWNEYKFISSRNSGVFNEDTHAKFSRVTRISIVAIGISFCTIAIILWMYLAPRVWPLSLVIGFNVFGRLVEFSWIVTMILILSPSLQKVGKSSTTATSFEMSKASHSAAIEPVELEETTSISVQGSSEA
ncbi:hypothetical protein SAMD00019534_036620, partial [Acytostelium subglobosum LB1]|uniref:hypothetical protein n=1 Tax=Acytostelium subglobosum LB1 TaxID=1410327 RepID=UPI000644C689